MQQIGQPLERLTVWAGRGRRRLIGDADGISPSPSWSVLRNFVFIMTMTWLTGGEAATEFRVWSGCSQGNHRRRYSVGGFFVQWAGNYGTGEFGNGLNGGFPAIDHCSIIQYNSLFTVIHMSITVATVPRPVREGVIRWVRSRDWR